MGQVTVSINGHAYAVACDPGQESRIRELARQIDAKVGVFAQQFSQAGEARLLVLAALTLADELNEARAAPGAQDPALAGGIAELARRIETVAAQLETPHV